MNKKLKNYYTIINFLLTFFLKNNILSLYIFLYFYENFSC